MNINKFDSTTLNFIERIQSAINMNHLNSGNTTKANTLIDYAGSNHNLQMVLIMFPGPITML